MHGGSTGVTRTEGRARDCSTQTKGSHRAPGSRRLLISECEWKRGEWRLSTDRQRADELVAKKVLERSLSGMTEIACGSKEFAPLSRFPQGQAGAGGFPPRREARCAPRKSAWHASMPPAPPQEGCRPLGDPLRVRWPRRLDRSGTTACLRKQIGPKIGRRWRIDYTKTRNCACCKKRKAATAS